MRHIKPLTCFRPIKVKGEYLSTNKRIRFTPNKEAVLLSDEDWWGIDEIDADSRLVVVSRRLKGCRDKQRLAVSVDKIIAVSPKQ